MKAIRIHERGGPEVLIYENAPRPRLTWLPPAFAIYYWRRFFASKMADYVFGRHARTASREMRELANDCRTLLEKSGVEAPALRQLYRAIDAYAA
jgi:CRISPR/Cas system-associated endonuclease Cas1